MDCHLNALQALITSPACLPQYLPRVVKYNKKVLPIFDSIFHAYLTRGLQKYSRNLIPTMAFWGQTKAGQKIAARLARLTVLSCRLIKKPPWDFNFLHIFLIPSSSRHEKHCQMVERLFVVFHHSRNIPWLLYIFYAFTIGAKKPKSSK